MTPSIEWTWPAVRDRIEVGAFFGAIGGVVALLIALGYGLAARWVGRSAPHGASLSLHAALIGLYLLAGLLIGAFWPRRQDGLGRWTLWMLAATPLSVTILALVRGSPLGWSERSWLHLAIMIPAFTWVIGDGPKFPRRESSS
jgi:hypothetical protein